MEVLSRLFDSKEKVRLLRFFVSKDDAFSVDTLMEVTGYGKRELSVELKNLKEAGFLKSSSRMKRTSSSKKVKEEVWMRDDRFMLTLALRELLMQANISEMLIMKYLNKIGTLRLVVLSGVFTNAKERTIDLLLVADNIQTRSLKSALRNIEDEVGQEITYSLFPSKEYKYREGLNDRLLRDIYDSEYVELFRRGI